MGRLGLTRTSCKRIVRIETVLEDIMRRVASQFPKLTDLGPFERDFPSSISRKFRDQVINEFADAISSFNFDPEVVGFKSVICYRTGLAIPCDLHQSSAEDAATWSELLKSVQEDQFERLEHEYLNPFFILLTASILHTEKNTLLRRKPLQFHTGLGDNSIHLRFSSPSHLQPFIKEYPKLPIVLLHASYPFTREAAYLASVYENVYLDIGEVFPMISQEGQQRVVAQALELCPSEKLMWSSDGHWFPETYLLAVIQVREAMEQVLSSHVHQGALELEQAVEIVRDIFFRTANRLYHLDIAFIPLLHPIKPTLHSSTGPSLWTQNLALFEKFLAENLGITFLRLQWLDYTSTLRLRILPVKKALEAFQNAKLIGIARPVFGLLQNDHMSDGFSPVGEYNLVPCFSSIRVGDKRKLATYATVQCEFYESDSSQVSICPRTVLRKIVERAQKTALVDFLVGFEIEVVFMSYETINGSVIYGKKPVSHGHSWSAARALHGPEMLSVLEEIVLSLEQAGIDLQQFHPEAAPGQYEFVTGPLPPLDAVDTLLATRDIISTIAAKHELRATLVPKPVPGACGTGCHFHLSVSEHVNYENFYAGVLKHFCAIIGFTYCSISSYDRAVDSAWAGGRWVSWGTHNRETPLRKVQDSHWEFRVVDGFANMYLVLAAVLGAGLDGIATQEPLRWKDCLVDPATVDEHRRQELGITQNLPSSVQEAFQYLREDHRLSEILGDGVVDTFLTVKAGEAAMLERMEPEARRNWLIERY